MLNRFFNYFILILIISAWIYGRSSCNSKWKKKELQEHIKSIQFSEQKDLEQQKERLDFAKQLKEIQDKKYKDCKEVFMDVNKIIEDNLIYD